MERKNICLIILVVVLSLLVAVLGGYIVYDKIFDAIKDVNNDNKDDTTLENNKDGNDDDDEIDLHGISLNKTFIIDEYDFVGDKANAKVYNEEIKINDKDDKIVNHSVTYSSKSLKVDDKTIVELEEGAYYLYQVSFYDDIIITSQSFSLGHWFNIYDYDGNVIKEINLFRDNENRLFHAYLRYSDDEIFNVSNSGVISFVGTKHVQGVAGTYLTDNGNEINILYDKYDIDDDSVVKGIFEISYLGNNNFSDIKCVKTIETFKEFKSR